MGSCGMHVTGCLYLLRYCSLIFDAETRMAMAVKLFEMNRLSSGMAAQLVGIDRVSFLLQLNMGFRWWIQL